MSFYLISSHPRDLSGRFLNRSFHMAPTLASDAKVLTRRAASLDKWHAGYVEWPNVVPTEKALASIQETHHCNGGCSTILPARDGRGTTAHAGDGR
jgi:hypothetical protein